MISLIFQILPLAIGAAISPVVLTLVLLTLSGRVHPLGRGVAMAIGVVSPLVVAGIAGLFFFRNAVRVAQSGHTPGRVSALIDLAFAVILLGLLIRTVVKKPKRDGASPESDETSVDESDEGVRPFRFAVFGTVLMLTNFTTIALFVPAVKVIAISHDPILTQLVALAVLILITSVTATIPVTFYAVAPTAASRVLTPIGDAAKKYNRTITIVLLIVFTAYLAYKGIRGL